MGFEWGLVTGSNKTGRFGREGEQGSGVGKSGRGIRLEAPDEIRLRNSDGRFS
jgi:hypothetical protein